MGRDDFFSDLPFFEGYDPEEDDWRYRFFSRPGRVRTRWLAEGFLANALGEGLMSIELLRRGNLGAARSFVASYGRLLRISHELVMKTSLYQDFRDVLSTLTAEWERRGTSLAREAAEGPDGRDWIDSLGRLHSRTCESARLAQTRLEELDELELVGWALQDEPGLDVFRRKLRAARRIFSDRIDLFLPAVDQAKAVAYLVGEGSTIQHDQPLVATLSKYKELLLEAARIARGRERLTCATLARKIPV